MTGRDDRADRVVRRLRRAVRGRRLSRPQAAVLDALLSIVVNEDVALLASAGIGRVRAGGRAMSAARFRPQVTTVTRWLHEPAAEPGRPERAGESARSRPGVARSACQVTSTSRPGWRGWRTTLADTWRAVVDGESRPVSRPVPPAPARRWQWSTWRRLAATWWVARETWWHLETGPLHPLADQVPLSQPRDAAHPAWCSQTYRGRGCGAPSVAGDGTVEWSHARQVEVEHRDGVADVCTLRMDAIRPGGAHDVTEAIVLRADGSFAADQAEAYALAILEAVRPPRRQPSGHAGGRGGGAGGGVAAARAEPRGVARRVLDRLGVLADAGPVELGARARPQRRPGDLQRTSCRCR